MVPRQVISQPASYRRLGILSSSFNCERTQVFYRRLQSPQSRPSQLLKLHWSPWVRPHWPSVFWQTNVRRQLNLQVQIRAGFPIQPQSHSSPSPFRHPLDSYGWIRYQERPRCHVVRLTCQSTPLSRLLQCQTAKTPSHLASLRSRSIVHCRFCQAFLPFYYPVSAPNDRTDR